MVSLNCAVRRHRLDHPQAFDRQVVDLDGAEFELLNPRAQDIEAADGQRPDRQSADRKSAERQRAERSGRAADRGKFETLPPSTRLFLVIRSSAASN